MAWLCKLACPVTLRARAYRNATEAHISMALELATDRALRHRRQSTMPYLAGDDIGASSHDRATHGGAGVAGMTVWSGELAVNRRREIASNPL